MSYLLSTAEFSPCLKYRYHLMRLWGKGNKMAMFIGLNPSTADARQDDPTVRRCINFAKDLGCNGMHMMNIFAYRATDPDVMKLQHDPIGEDNDHWLRAIALDADVCICCWGVHGAFLNRGGSVRFRMKELILTQCFGKTKDGHPKHPLYLKADTKLTHF